ncbi:MAG: GNAT family N-acetyltransferase [Chloroflexota bacterium]|nr:GNAT family N-acetyltransferase [Chloroflexota bacterium]MDE2920064.1 GNAT family N-acetyltransferase [Chloroflexota bacterium]
MPALSMDGPRAPRADEFDELVAQVNRVMREEVGAAPTYGEEWPRIYCLDNLENIRVIRADGRIVSSAAIYPHEVRYGDARLWVGGITGVATDAAYRRRGLATRVMHACIERTAELGCHLSLLGSGVPSWYRKLGWEYAGLERKYQFSRGNRHLLPTAADLEMRTVKDGDFERLAAIHAARALGGVRSADLLRSMWSPKPGAEVWVALNDREVRAYLRVRGTSVTEYGGPAELVLPMLARLLESWDDPAVPTSTRSIEERQVNTKPTVHASLDAPWRPDDVTEALDALGILRSAGYVRMIRIKNPQGLLRAYGRTDLNARADCDRIVVETGDRTLRLSRTDAVKLFFGPERPVQPDVAGLPFVFHVWLADRV